MFVFLVTKQVADHTDANDGKVITDDGTKKLDTLAFLITIKDGKRTTDLPHNAGDITMKNMVSILSIIEENLLTKSSKTWTLFEITLHHMFSRPELYTSEH